MGKSRHAAELICRSLEMARFLSPLPTLCHLAPLTVLRFDLFFLPSMAFLSALAVVKLVDSGRPYSRTCMQLSACAFAAISTLLS